MEAGWSARRVSRQLRRSDCVVRRCWHQCIREMSFTRRPGSGCPRQTSRREDHHNVRNARVQPTASSVTLQAQVAPSLEAPVSSRTIQRRLSEGHLGSRRPLRELLLTSTHQRLRLEWCRSRGNWTAAEWNQFFFSNADPDSISAVMTIVFLCGDSVVIASILHLFYSDTSLPHWCDSMGCHRLQYTVIPSIDLWHHDSPAVCP
ncbi:HTH_Tnp_Tc3_2 domain-containing protein [Trichonephila clavipes]|nr:HTH_Tnp_Tc3_2 domain-containing protein [Trichonephila clavipes]